MLFVLASGTSIDSLTVPLILAVTAIGGIATASIGLGAVVGQLKRAVLELDRLANAVEDLRERVIRLETKLEGSIDQNRDCNSKK